MASASGFVLLALPAAPAPRPLLVWNTTASAPLGLYWVRSASGLVVGDPVVARLPPAARALAARRQYLPAGIPVVKRFAAIGGAIVCAVGTRITIDGRPVAIRLVRDRAGRALPGWEGCRRLANGQAFLIGDGPDSFDSRYFGAVPRADLIGRAVLLWRR
ncbi:S26 family signal peptidase [Sphingomonas koreensis]|nr:S26 family signal peptidase [Sphingomonas koreensis]